MNFHNLYKNSKRGNNISAAGAFSKKKKEEKNTTRHAFYENMFVCTIVFSMSLQLFVVVKRRPLNKTKTSQLTLLPIAKFEMFRNIFKVLSKEYILI